MVTASAHSRDESSSQAVLYAAIVEPMSPRLASASTRAPAHDNRDDPFEYGETSRTERLEERDLRFDHRRHRPSASMQMSAKGQTVGVDGQSPLVSSAACGSIRRRTVHAGRPHRDTSRRNRLMRRICCPSDGLTVHR